MLIPFQRLLYHRNPQTNLAGFILAGAGPTLRVFSANNTGQLISKWSHLGVDNPTRNNVDEPPEDDPEEPSTKRRKLDTGDVSDTPSAEIVTENNSGRRKPKRHGFTVPCITHLCGTADGKHIVVVTGEDKAVRVLSISENGILHQLSQRIMPKRPSSLTLTPLQDTILCSDKFGDVYSMPLLGFTGDIPQEAKAEDKNGESETSMKPSASEKTVHTKRNLRVLEEQKKQKKIKKERADLQFQHSLLLGHVSLLTDIASVEVKTTQGRTRRYILSADRDEHIRVSRGIPQSHMIESYCLGHEQFVNKIHIPAWQPDILISGGGDDYLLVWNWRTGTIKQKVELKKHILGSLKPPTERSIAVSGIWSVPQTADSGSGEIIVACEAVPGLIFFRLKSCGNLDSEPKCIKSTPSNVLDVAVDPDQGLIYASMDNTHQPWTTDLPSVDKDGPAIRAFHLVGNWSWVPGGSHVETEINKVAKTTNDPLTEALDASALSNILYSVEHLRKRGGAEVNDEGAEIEHDTYP